MSKPVALHPTTGPSNVSGPGGVAEHLDGAVGDVGDVGHRAAGAVHEGHRCPAAPHPPVVPKAVHHHKLDLT